MRVTNIIILCIFYICMIASIFLLLSSVNSQGLVHDQALDDIRFHEIRGVLYHHAFTDISCSLEPNRSRVILAILCSLMRRRGGLVRVITLK